MKLSENVEVESNAAKASNSRASRMARYSAAAAGVAAVSSIEVDAAMIKVIVTDPNAQGTSSYQLDLGHIVTGAGLTVGMSSSSYAYINNLVKASTVSSSSSSSLYSFLNNQEISGSMKGGLLWTSTGTSATSMSSTSAIFGFRLVHGNSNYTYGWLKATFFSSSSMTLNSYGYNDTLNAAAIAGQGSSAVPDSGPGVVGLALLGAGAAGVRLLRKLRAGK